jgi:hydroxyethylthiazole kinase-like uncharacterized protein yjeF
VTTPVTVTAQVLRDWPLPSPQASEKHSRGLALVVGGSTGTPGAVRLAAEAALRAGCGKVRIATVSPVAAELGAAVPEARVLGFDATPSGNLEAGAATAIADIAAEADATLVGCGLTDPDDAEALVAAMAPAIKGPVVLDALATAYVDSRRDLADVQGPCVLTVNPTELAHVLDLDQDAVTRDPAAAVDSLVASSGAVVLLGGDTKVIGAPEGRCYRVTAGGAGLATAGSGDVQAGLLAGLLARGADAVQAAVWAAWLHANAGDRLADRVGTLGFLARELAAEVPALIDEVGPRTNGRPG